MNQIRRLFLTALILCCPAGPALAETLWEQLDTLAERDGFEIEGLDLLGQAPARPAGSGPAAERIRSLLSGYNYLLLYDSDGRPARLRITGLKGPRPEVPPRNAVKTRREGSHHLVEASITGPSGRRETVSLIVDTGASTVVLPESMIARLGFRAESLRKGWAQTANGRVPVKLATLPGLGLGALRARDIAVSFVADDRLGGRALLGMSFLERFRFTLDDQSDQLILMNR